jgi:hypothetical protein
MVGTMEEAGPHRKQPDRAGRRQAAQERGGTPPVGSALVPHDQVGRRTRMGSEASGGAARTARAIYKSQLQWLLLEAVSLTLWETGAVLREGVLVRTGCFLCRGGRRA